jgi:DNA-binding CsgD family transcriptional regulator
LCACFLADAQLARDIEAELLELAGEFAPTWSATEIKSCASSVYARAQAAAHGETTQFGGRDVDPRYRWRNATLIERLCITPEEEHQLTTIISREEKRQRSVARSAKARLDSGCQPRAQWLESVEQRRASARLLRAQGLSYSRIAAELGVSVGAAHAYCTR